LGQDGKEFGGAEGSTGETRQLFVEKLDMLQPGQAGLFFKHEVQASGVRCLRTE
jgi:hypothetical protein